MLLKLNVRNEDVDGLFVSSRWIGRCVFSISNLGKLQLVLIWIDAETYKWKKMKNWSLVWNPAFIWHTVDGWGLQASHIRYILCFYLNSEGLFQLHLPYMPINGFVADAFGSWPGQLVQVIFEVARFGERLPKRYVFKKSRRDQKRWLILVGGMNHFQCYWRLFSGVLRVEFSHLVFLWRWWSCSLWSFSFKALCLCSVLRGRQGDLLHGAGGGDVLSKRRAPKKCLREVRSF